MFRSLFLLGIIVFSILSSAETKKPRIISGFDDVLRQAENTSLLKAALKLFEKDKTFSGMPELYQGLTKDELQNPKLSLVSAISFWFQGRISEFLLEFHFPSLELLLRNWLTEWSIENFKLSRIQKILARYPERQFIVIFDNSQASLEISEKLVREYKTRISELYLRQVVLRELPSKIVPFFTAFDIAINEYRSNHISKNDLETVANAILNESIAEKIIPAYAYCPKEYNPCPSGSQDIVNLCGSVKNKILKICNLR